MALVGNREWLALAKWHHTISIKHQSSQSTPTPPGFQRKELPLKVAEHSTSSADGHVYKLIRIAMHAAFDDDMITTVEA